MKVSKRTQSAISMVICVAPAVFSIYILVSRGPFAMVLFGRGIAVNNMIIPLTVSAAACFFTVAMRNRFFSLLPAAVLVFVTAACFIYSEMVFDPVKNYGNVPVSTGGGSVFRGFNLIVISLDTLRADRLGVYGYHRDTSPEIDSFAGSGVVFEKTYSQSPNTQPSHAVMFTGMYPETTGANMVNSPMPDSAETLAERLAGQGYTTAAFVGGGLVSAALGFDQGFEIFNESHRSISGSWPLAREWLDRNSGIKFFLFLHCYDIHMPYEPPPPYNTMFDPDYDGPLPDRFTFETVDAFPEDSLTENDIGHVSAIYDGGIRYTDRFIGEITGYLKSKGLLDSTIVVILSDHGEELGEHGRVAVHSHTVYEELLRVPLIIYVPGLKAKRVVTRVGLVDLAPTLLEMLGVPHDPGTMQGASFAGLLDAGAGAGVPDRLIFAQQRRMAGDTGIYVTVLKGNWKFILLTRGKPDVSFNRIFGGTACPLRERMLFDISEDPAEMNNLLLRKTALARSLEFSIINLGAINDRMKLKSDRKADYSEEQLKKLKDLGYIK